MTVELRLPEAGMGITEGTITKWHKSEGESISQFELLVEVETAKAVEEIESPVTGVLKKILVGEDESVEVNAVLAILEDVG